MERIRDTRSTGLKRSTLRTWGMIIVAAGIVGRCILQNQLLGLGKITGQELMEAMNSPEMMGYATAALILQVLEACAVPIFACLLVEGFQHTSDYTNYFLRVAGVAVLSELPYNLAMSGSWLDASSRNPVFGLVLCLVLLYFFKRYEGKTLQNIFVKVVVLLAACIWTTMLKIDNGLCLVLVACVLWLFRGNVLYRNFAGATVSIVCSLISPFFLAAPMGFLLVHFYHGEKGQDNRVVNYLAYPVLLLVIGLVGLFI